MKGFVGVTDNAWFETRNRGRTLYYKISLKPGGKHELREPRVKS